MCDPWWFIVRDLVNAGIGLVILVVAFVGLALVARYLMHVADRQR